jgi:hypothetical protein
LLNFYSQINPNLKESLITYFKKQNDGINCGAESERKTKKVQLKTVNDDEKQKHRQSQTHHQCYHHEKLITSILQTIDFIKTQIVACPCLKNSKQSKQPI